MLASLGRITPRPPSARSPGGHPVLSVCGVWWPRTIANGDCAGNPNGKAWFWAGEKANSMITPKGIPGRRSQIPGGGQRKACLTPEFPDLPCGSLICGPWVGGLCSLRHCCASILNRSAAPRYPGGRCTTETIRLRYVSGTLRTFRSKEGSVSGIGHSGAQCTGRW